MNPQYYAGVDVGGTNIKMVLCDAAFSPLAQGSIPTLVPTPPAQTAERIGDNIEKMAREANLPPKGLAGIGVALPGLTDSKNNIPIRMGVLHWREGEMDIAPLMEKRFGVPVQLINDGSAHLVGESRFGAAKGYQNVLSIALGTGVGGAFMADGKIVTGEYGLASEIGHIVLEVENGERCGCGSTGCLQAYCSTSGILPYTRRRMQEQRNTLLWQLCGGDAETLDTKMITAGADAGDELCLAVYARASRYLGAGIASLVSMLNPALILMGGGLANAYKYLVEPAKLEAERRLMHVRQLCPIEPVTLGEMAGAWGSCVWIAGQVEGAAG